MFLSDQLSNSTSIKYGCHVRLSIMCFLVKFMIHFLRTKRYNFTHLTGNISQRHIDWVIINKPFDLFLIFCCNVTSVLYKNTLDNVTLYGLMSRIKP